MNVRSRLQQLERRLNVTAGCLACLDRVELRVWRVQTEPRPEPARCAECGRDMTLLVKIVYDTRSPSLGPRLPDRNGMVSRG